MPSDATTRGGSPGRRARRIALVAVLLSLAVVAAGVAAWNTQGARLGGFAADLLNERVFLADSTRLHIAHVGGFPANRLELRGVTLERRLPDGGWYTFAGARELTVRFDPFDLLNARYEVGSVEGSGFVLDIRRDAGGNVLIPLVRGGGGAPGGPPPTLGARSILLRDSAFHLDIPVVPLSLTHAKAEATLFVRGGRIDIDLLDVDASLGDSLGVLTDLTGQVRIGGGEGVALDGLAARWDGEPLTVHGTPDDQGDLVSLRVTGEEVPAYRLGILFDLPNLEPGYLRTVDITFDLSVEPVTFTATTEGRWDKWTITDGSLGGIIEDDFLTLTDVALTSTGTRITEGTVWIPLDGPEEVSLEARFSGFPTDSLPFMVGLRAVPGSLNGRTRVEIPDRKRAREHHRVTVWLDPGEILHIPLVGGYAEAEGGAEDGWRIDTLRVDLDRASAEAHGYVGPGDVDLDFAFSGDLQPLRAMVRLEDLEGSGFLTGRLHGPPAELRLEAEGTATDLSVARMRFPRVELRRAAGPVAEGRHLELDILTAAPFTLAGTPVDFAEGRVTVYEGRVVLEDLELTRGDSTAVVSGEVTWADGVRVALDRAAAHLGDRSFRLEEETELLFRGNIMSTPGMTLLTPRGTLRLAGSFDRSERRLGLRLGMEGLDPSVLEDPDAPFPFTMRRVDGSLTLEGVLPILDGAADVRIDGLAWNGFLLDSLDTRVAVAGREVLLDRMVASRGRGKVRAAGTVSMPAPLYTVLEAEVFGPDLDPDSTRWNIDVNAERVILQEWFGFLRPSRRPWGQLDGTLALRGSSANPAGTTRLAVRAAHFRGFSADSLRVRGGLKDGDARIEDLRVWQRGRMVQLAGLLPVDLRFKPFTYGIPERPMALDLRADGGSLQSLRLTPWVDEASGYFNATILARGTPRRPDLQGEITAVADTVRLADRDEVLTNGSAWITLDGNELTVVAAEARIEGGRADARGTYRLFASPTETYALDITFRDAVVRESGRYAARVSGRLQVLPRLVEGRVYPFVTGDIDVDRAEYIGTLRPQDAQSVKPRSFLYEVNIRADKHIYVTNDEVEAELTADLRVEQRVDRQVIQGTMDILRATYRLFLKQFRVTEGQLIWNRPDTRLPDLDITAETFQGSNIIVVHLTGPMDEPVIEFTAYNPDTGEDEGLSDEEIVQNLAIGSIGLQSVSFLAGEADNAAGGTSGEQAVGAIVQGSQILLRDVEDQLLDQLGLIDDIQVSPEYNEGRLEYKVQVRKYLTPDLSVRYEQGLSRYFDQNIAVEYRLGRLLFLRGETLRERLTDSSSVRQRYNLDVTVRHEY